MNATFVRARLGPTVAALVTLAAGLGARAFLSGAVAKYLGVALWATLVYALVVWARPDVRVRRAAAVALAVSFAVEFAQLTPGPAYLSSKHVLLRLIFGAYFSAWDLPAYAAGVALGAAVHALTRRVPLASPRG